MIVGVDARVPLSRGRGWGRYAEEFLAVLSRQPGVTVRALLPRSPAAQRLADALPASAQVHTAPFSLPATGDYLAPALEASDPLAALGDVDVLHCLTRFVPRTRQRPIVATVHDVAPLADPPFKQEVLGSTRRAIGRLAAYGCEVIAISEATARALSSLGAFDARRLHVVHQGVGASFLEGAATEEACARAPRDLLYIGGAGPNKNLHRLVEAIRRLREREDVRLVLAGAPEWGYEALFSEIRGPGGALPGWLSFRGHVGDRELRALYRRSAALVLPSLHEGFGLPILEAMALGTPVCCSDIPVLREVAGGTAHYFDPLDAGALAASLAAVLRQPARARALAERGLARAARFRWDRTARETVRVYHRALARSRGVAAPLHHAQRDPAVA